MPRLRRGTSGPTATTAYPSSVSAVKGLSEVYQDFQDALDQLRRTGDREGVELTAIPAPTHLAPFAAAVRAEVRRRTAPSPGAPPPAVPAAAPTADRAAGAPDDELATGRFVLLHDPSEPAPWGGPFRIVTWARAAASREIGCDDAAGAIAWTWLLEALERHRAGYSREGGTASRVLAEGFGLLGDQADGADVELRASWTPAGSDVAPHLAAWADTVCTLGGLPPYPRGVTVLHPRR